MKKAVKKIAAVAMAFTLLGTGTTVINTFSPKSDNTLVASAACNHSTARKDEWVEESVDIINFFGIKIRVHQMVRGYVDYCPKCGQVFGHGKY